MSTAGIKLNNNALRNRFESNSVTKNTMKTKKIPTTAPRSPEIKTNITDINIGINPIKNTTIFRNLIPRKTKITELMGPKETIESLKIQIFLAKKSLKNKNNK